MTGHLDGTGVSGNLNIRNEQIRTYCRNNNKILYDFADIESYDPDNVYYLNRRADDNCDYDSNNDGSSDRNWARDWQNSHPVNVDWYNCTSAHSQPLNANRKAYAAWWLWARLAGWNGLAPTIPVTEITVSGTGGQSMIPALNGTLQLNAEVLPANATNRTVSWSITNGTGQASISLTGLVTAVSAGSVTAMAMANDGSGVSGTFSIAIVIPIIHVTGIAVTGAGGSSSISTDDGTLQLNAMVNPTNASNGAVFWSIAGGTGQASVSSSGLVTAIADGNVTAVATAADGSAISGILEITISNQVIPVSGITIKSEGGSNIISSENKSLQLITEISPVIATNKSVSWSVLNITGQASINDSGLLTGIGDGLVTVMASAADGSGVTSSIDIRIRVNSPLTVIVTGNQMKIPLDGNFQGCRVSLYDMQGHLINIHEADSDLCEFDISSIQPGVYVVVLSGSVIRNTAKVIIPR